MFPNTDPDLMDILAFAGSLRKASFNKALLWAASNLAPDDITGNTKNAINW